MAILLGFERIPGMKIGCKSGAIFIETGPLFTKTPSGVAAIPLSAWL
jgi:hypothetical protein